MAFHSGKPRKGAHLIKTDKKKAEKTAAALPQKRRVPAALLVILVLIVLLAGGALGTAYFYPNIFPGVTVGSIDVGGLSRDEAAQQIATKSKPLYQGKKLTLTIYDADYDIPVENVLSGVDDIQSAENAWKVGREGGPLTRMTAIISAMRNGCDTRLDASVDESGLKAQLEEIAAKALTEPVAPTWKLDGENLVIQSGTPGVQFDTAAVEQALTAQIELMDFKPYSITYTLIKTVFFAYIITSISAFYGYYAKGNSLEVGTASTRAVVACSVVILLFDLILTQVLLI